MASNPNMEGNLDNWNPGAGGTDSPSKRAQLLSTEAADDPDCINGTNKLERFNGKAKTPSGPFGVQGQEF